MATVTFESIIPEILPLVPDCTDLIIIRALRRSCEEFLTKSLVWRVDLDEHTTEIGEPIVELDIPKNDLRVTQIKSVTIATKDITQISDDQKAPNPTETFCSLINFGKALRLTPIPRLASPMLLKVVLSTTPNSSGVDRDVETHIHEHLIDGALARLYAMPGMPWADSSLAAYHGAIFQAAIIEMRGRAENNNGRAVRTVSYGGV